ncbi:FAD/NAD(P)-binding domain-containing protein [Poronia punctata]|nr:FAD/NAD(P)-binding domain-containing protein [Poronia punctata]
MHVLIVGAGVGGLSLAQCLRRQGIPFTIFERDVDEHSRFQGWAVALYGVIIDEMTSSFPSDLPDFRDSTSHLAPLSLPSQICMYYSGKEGRIGFEDSSEFPIVRAERMRLRSWLARNLHIQWGKRATRVEHSHEGVEVHFDDGTSAKGDILVGADGVHSIVKKHLLQHAVSSGLNLVPLATIVGELTLSGDAFKRQLALGHSGYMYMSQELGFWSFCGLHRVLEDGVSGRFYWMFLQQDSGVSDQDHWLQTASQQKKLGYVLRLTAQLPDRFREIFELTPVSGIREEAHVWRDFDLSKVDVPAGRIVLLGDAAHTMVPFRGGGALHAILDALKLSKLLGRLRESRVEGDISLANITAAVAEYNAEMIARSSRAVQDARNLQPISTRGDEDSLQLPPGAKVLPERDIVLDIVPRQLHVGGN